METETGTDPACMIRRAVFYCGGCRAGYDRDRAKQIIEKIMDTTLEKAERGVYYDEIFFLYGCSAVCASRENLIADRMYVITKMPDEKTIRRWQENECTHKGCTAAILYC